MYRGTRKFRCPNCGEVFTAPDIELNATAASVPQRCPRCGRMVSGANESTNIIGAILGLFHKD